MADEQVVNYGYETDEVVASPFNFGLNPGKTFLTKFEWTPSGGKDGAEMEALDIVFNINGKDKNYRLFPVKQAFGKNGEIITDPKAPEFIEAFKVFNAIITHIAHAFISDEAYKTGLSRQRDSFKQFCEIVKNLLPKNTPSIALDIFMQWQYRPSSGQTRTFLEIPKNMKQGKWLCPAQPGKWKEVREENPADNSQEALIYYDENEGTKLGEDGKTVYYNKIHPIKKNGWFMKSPYANRVDIGGGANSGSSSSALVAPNTGTAAPQANTQDAAIAQNAAPKTASTW